MTHSTNEDFNYLKDQLQETDDQRFENLEALSFLLAENRFLRSIVSAMATKPLEQILRDGWPLIEAAYQDYEKLCHQGTIEVIEKMKRKIKFDVT